jgi:YD repeat-containing protein
VLRRYTFSYDALDRVTGVNEFGKLLTFAYDGVVNRTVMTTEVGTTTSTYDAANNLTRHEFAATGYPTLRVDFAYNAGNMLDRDDR